MQYALGWETSEQRIWFDIPCCVIPWQSIQILPDDYQDYMLEAIDFMKQNKANEEFVDYEGSQRSK